MFSQTKIILVFKNFLDKITFLARQKTGEIFLQQGVFLLY